MPAATSGLLHVSIIDANQDFFEALVNARKHAWRIAKVVGFKMMFKFLFRRLGVKELEKEATRILGGQARVIELPYAELAMMLTSRIRWTCCGRS
ncbi:MAG: hypothetical protein M5U34_01780 [Chloroflexi bacterium]|nr:hypothetical protein [Chloroflexota bacterium]